MGSTPGQKGPVIPKHLLVSRSLPDGGPPGRGRLAFAFAIHCPGVNFTENGAQAGGKLLRGIKTGPPHQRAAQLFQKDTVPISPLGDLCVQDHLAQDFMECAWGWLCVVSQTGQSLRSLGLKKCPSSCMNTSPLELAVPSILGCAVTEQNSGWI